MTHKTMLMTRKTQTKHGFVPVWCVVISSSSPYDSWCVTVAVQAPVAQETWLRELDLATGDSLASLVYV